VSTSINGLPIVPDTALPADVRKGTDDQKQTYKAALGFERELLGQLMQSMNATAQGDGSEDDSGDAATSTYKQMLPDQLTDAVISGGGTGLAENLYRALREGKS
jgi:Rod binding domain-containing protein